MAPDSDPDSRAGLRELLPYVRPHRRVLLVAIVLGLLGAAAGLAQPLGAREVLEALAADDSLLVPLVVLGALVVFGAVCGTAEYYLLDRTAERIVLGARRRLISRLLRIRMGVLDFHAPGDLVARATSDATLLGSVASMAIVQLTGGTVTLLGALVLMATVEPLLLAVTMAVLLAIGAAVALILPRIARAMEQQQAAVGALGGALERVLQALRTVRASGAEERELERADGAIRHAYERGVQTARYNAIVNTAAGLAIQASFLVVLGTGGALVAAGSLAMPDLIAFLLYLFYLSGPIIEISTGATQLQGGLAALRRLQQAERLPVEEDQATSVPATDDAAPVVAFEGVGFRYREGVEAVLDDVSFVVPRVGLTAIVGPSGAGKTTTFALLERFYDPTAGRILMAGRDLREWPRAALRARLGYVEQDAPVLAGTVRENLLLAAPDASDERIARVVAEARLEPLIARLPDGLESEVGTRGTTLSGGERQRVAIARALLRDPDVLLLDEASSQLDAANEAALRETVERVAASRAVVAIAHRLSTVVAARQIVLLEDGRVRAVGTHHELLAADRLYAEHVALQLGAGDQLVDERRA
ncbi:ABC transporter ATP-binding protein [Patulibacter defluvii]|uniref:ABC transporter ATP-binding protein n=1 Tax=Patulibacter defluvii TaxID=3095358 RepID=UPI002A7562EC|nr:ABC transporter ATP-binding protein [Patulibacter sp. DM4]